MSRERQQELKNTGVKCYVTSHEMTLNGSCAVNCEACSIVKKIVASAHLKLNGIHAQIGTDIRDLSLFQRLSENLNAFAIYLKQTYALELLWIDVGGGLAGINPRSEEQRMTPPLSPLFGPLQPKNHRPAFRLSQ